MPVYGLPPCMKMVNRTNTVTHFQRIGFCQRAREPDLRLLHRIRPCGVTRTQRRQRRRERTARAVGVLVWTRGAVKRCVPSWVKSQSGLSASSRWPPFISTARHPIASSAFPCSFISRSFCACGASSSAAASGRFGVISATCGSSFYAGCRQPRRRAADRRFWPASRYQAPRFLSGSV